MTAGGGGMVDQANHFVVNPTAAWFTLWQDERLKGNGQLNPRDIFDWSAPKLVRASDVNDAAERVMSGEVGGKRTVLGRGKISGQVDWSVYFASRGRVRLVCKYPAEAVKRLNLLDTSNGSQPVLMAEWSVEAVE